MKIKELDAASLSPRELNSQVKESAKDYLQDKISLTKNTRFVYNHIITADTETCIVEQNNQKYGFITDISITISYKFIKGTIGSPAQ